MTDNDRLSDFAKRMKGSFPAMPQTQIADYLQGAENRKIAAPETEPEPEPATPPVGATIPIGAVDTGHPAHSPHHPSAESTSLISAVIAHRRRHGLTQEQLAAELGISVRTLRDWEQGRRQPQGPARALLQRVILP